MNKVVIEVRGGNVVGCYSGRVDLAVCLMDWDNIANEESAMRVPVTPVSQYPFETGKRAEFPCIDNNASDPSSRH